MPTDETPNPAEAATAEAPATSDTTSLREELLRERFDAVAARAGLDEDFVDVVGAQAHKHLEREGKEATRENIAAFLDNLRATKPRLFVRAATAVTKTTAQRDTAPTAPHVPAPPPAALETPYAKWRALKVAGRTAEAQAYFRAHRVLINRSA